MVEGVEGYKVVEIYKAVLVHKQEESGEEGGWKYLVVDPPKGKGPDNDRWLWQRQLRYYVPGVHGPKEDGED